MKTSRPARGRRRLPRRRRSRSRSRSSHASATGDAGSASAWDLLLWGEWGSDERHQTGLEELRAAIQAEAIEHTVAVGQLHAQAFGEVPVHHGRDAPEPAAEDALVV